MNMFISSTPEKSLPPLDRLRHSVSKPNLQLPPLSELLNSVEQTPYKQRLPTIGNLTPLETPRYTTPSSAFYQTPLGTDTSLEVPKQRSPVSRPSHKEIISDSILSNSHNAISNAATVTVSNTPNTVPAIVSSTPLTVPATVTISNTSMDSDADVSINDSMIRPATKRKAVTSPSRDFAFISHSPATYPSQEPSIDNASLARRKRRRTSPNELAILNQEFLNGSTPEKARRIEIARRVNMSEKAIQIWFQNKRQSLRRLKSTDKEVTLLPPTPDSSTVASAIPTETAPTPLYESTPIRPSIIKSHSQHFSESPAMAQSSPIRSYSTSNLQPFMTKDANKNTLLSKILASEKKDPQAELVMNLTNKKQPEFARQSASASTQLMTFKLTPKDRKPLGALDANQMNKQRTKDNQCIQGLLSLRAANH